MKVDSASHTHISQLPDFDTQAAEITTDNLLT